MKWNYYSYLLMSTKYLLHCHGLSYPCNTIYITYDLFARKKSKIVIYMFQDNICTKKMKIDCSCLLQFVNFSWLSQKNSLTIVLKVIQSHSILEDPGQAGCTYRTTYIPLRTYFRFNFIESGARTVWPQKNMLQDIKNMLQHISNIFFCLLYTSDAADE